ncbi:MerR family transcriptional regulator [Bacillus tianshenii]|nr:MerR family transcriptional regulator [Bacillus tianshenii]
MYKIGELAKLSDVSKRTIDYYTKIGLLDCQRSETGYRYFSEEAIEDIKFIEQCKKMHMTLEEIKQRKCVLQSSEFDEAVVLQHIEHMKDEMGHLETELKEMYRMIKNLDESERKVILNHLSPQMLGLVQSLALFIG